MMPRRSGWGCGAGGCGAGCCGGGAEGRPYFAAMRARSSSVVSAMVLLQKERAAMRPNYLMCCTVVHWYDVTRPASWFPNSYDGGVDLPEPVGKAPFWHTAMQRELTTLEPGMDMGARASLLAFFSAAGRLP